jgi:hypothetical protein
MGSHQLLLLENGMKPKYTVRYICTSCGEVIGYIGWLFTVTRMPLLKHKCKENT